MHKQTGCIPNGIDILRPNFALFYLVDKEKENAHATRIVPIHWEWFPHSFRKNLSSMPDFLLRGLAYYSPTSAQSKNTFEFRGREFRTVREMHMHHFGKDGGFPGVHRQRKGLIRSLALSIHIAAFFDGKADFFKCRTWDEMVCRLAQVGRHVLDHGGAFTAWYYIWCPIDGVGMRHWFTTPLPANGGPYYGPYPAPF